MTHEANHAAECSTSPPDHHRRSPLLGDVVASLFVGISLIEVYEILAGFEAAPLLGGYLVPLIVYRFSTWWNHTTFRFRRAGIIAIVMGTLFAGVHHLPLPRVIADATGFIAPLIVSWLGRGAGADPEPLGV